MKLDFSEILRSDPVPFLLKKVPPYLKYHIYSELFEIPTDVPMVRDAMEQAQSDDVFRRLLKRQNDDGLWEPKQEFAQEQHQLGIQFFSQALMLHRLLELGGTREIPAIQKGIVALMKMQHGDGKFPLFYQHQGYALWVLLRYGLQGNPFVDRGLRWLLRRQRDDGGWLHLVQVPRGEDKEKYPSCIWTTCHALWPMTLHNVYYKDEPVQKGVEFLLDHFLDTNHTKFFNTPDAWDYLYLGHDESGCFRGGTLKVLEIASQTGFDRSNDVIKKASNWLRDQQLENGLFPAIAGKDSNGDYMVTIRMLQVLKRLYPETIVEE
ncbi:MAG: hypothetical protein MAGBODY4_00958 [Candidatus Marinimicrobia bacterium]|nr:hypothetical protein [Candidatus Neomarinimicrobiota bacterium]